MGNKDKVKYNVSGLGKNRFCKNLARLKCVLVCNVDNCGHGTMLTTWFTLEVICAIHLHSHGSILCAIGNGFPKC